MSISIAVNTFQMMAKQSQSYCGLMNSSAHEQKLEKGPWLIVYDEQIRHLGALRRGKWFDGWVADIFPGTVKDSAAGEFEHLRALKMRTAMKGV